MGSPNFLRVGLSHNSPPISSFNPIIHYNAPPILFYICIFHPTSLYISFIVFLNIIYQKKVDKWIIRVWVNMSG